MLAPAGQGQGIIGAKYFNNRLEELIEFKQGFFSKKWSVHACFKHGNQLFGDLDGKITQFLSDCKMRKICLFHNSSERIRGQNFLDRYESFCALIQSVDAVAKDFAQKLKDYNKIFDEEVITGSFAVMCLEDAQKITSEMALFITTISANFLSPGKVSTYLPDRIKTLKSLLQACGQSCTQSQ